MTLSIYGYPCKPCPLSPRPNLAAAACSYGEESRTRGARCVCERGWGGLPAKQERNDDCCRQRADPEKPCSVTVVFVTCLVCPTTPVVNNDQGKRTRRRQFQRGFRRRAKRHRKSPPHGLTTRALLLLGRTSTRLGRRRRVNNGRAAVGYFRPGRRAAACRGCVFSALGYVIASAGNSSPPGSDSARVVLDNTVRFSRRRELVHPTPDESAHALLERS
ncbi:hypothetical protein HPB51_017373 [Rhipicephalus microplus]|uniref:Uncharacterized protein n=1 Tax=Rhipicephalus microplus TaxID=6941 RepID=A0A9J6DVI7_RHIMP|nr:hypothetical protein HPB51_017373 [Rhipicephalus microplus]